MLYRVSLAKGRVQVLAIMRRHCKRGKAEHVRIAIDPCGDGSFDAERCLKEFDKFDWFSCSCGTNWTLFQLYNFDVIENVFNFCSEGWYLLTVSRTTKCSS